MRKKLLLAIAFSLGIWSYVLLLAATPPQRPAAPPVVTASAAEDGIVPFFSPSGGCTEAIVAEMAKAAQTIDIQAYSFTSPVIAQAVADAAARGVKIRVLLDKSQRGDHYSVATFLQNHHVPTFIDDQHGIAHNKIVILDGKVLITGSFNFTKASEERNAENVLIIHDRPKLIGAFQANFDHHLNHSTPLEVPIATNR